jgi:UDP-GlcNAc:undecaprenyl-phosphate/decaprenyl-phosphate GlcNAc-1-phosphate transferase
VPLEWTMPAVAHLLASFALPFSISLVLTAALLRLAPRLGLVDQPGDRKIHTRTTPKGGGLAIFAAVFITSLLIRPGDTNRVYFLTILIGSFVVLLGLIDDARPLPWQLRLTAQFVAAAAIVYFAGDSLPLPGVLSVLWIVALTNAFNMLDNMDSLSGGVAFIAAGLMAVAQLLRESAHFDFNGMAIYLVLAGAVGGFLVFNKPPAQIFMGDAGSTFLGFTLGCLAISRDVVVPEEPKILLVPVCVMAVPCYDLTMVVLLRLRQGRSPFHADKQHISHRLLLLDLAPPTAVLVILLLALVSGIAGLLVYPVANKWAFLIAIQVLALWSAVARIEYFRHWRGH